MRTCVGGRRRSKPALGQQRTRPGEVGRRAGRTRISVPAPVVIEDPGPSLGGAHGLGYFGEICHPAAMWVFQFGVEQPQHDNVHAVMLTDRLNHRFDVRPPWRCNRHG